MQRKNCIFISIIIYLASQIIYGQEKQFLYDGQMRTYTVYEPLLHPNPDGHPLVIGLHGTDSMGNQFLATAGLVQKANKEKFIAVCPNALVNNILKAAVRR